MENQALENQEKPAEIAQENTLKEAVEESKEAILNAAPIKRRGRPKKDPNEAPKPKKEATPAQAQVASAFPPADFLKPVVNFPFQALALKTGWAGWNLTEEEKSSNAILLDLCLKRYLPQLQSEHAELIGLAIGLGMAGVSRYMAFQSFLQAQKKVINETTEENSNTPLEKKIVKPKKETSPMARFLDNGPQISPSI